MLFKVYEGNVDRLEKLLAKVERKCKKHGAPFHAEKVKEEIEEIKLTYGDTLQEEEIYTKEEDKGYSIFNKPKYAKVKYCYYEIEGIAKYNNYIVVGYCEQAPNNTVLINKVGTHEIDIPTYYYNLQNLICEHCKRGKKLKKGYIVYNTTTNDYKLVGSGCLKEYTSGYSAEEVARFYESFETLATFETPYIAERPIIYLDLEYLLSWSVAIVDCFGFAPSSYEEDSTKDMLLSTLAYTKGRMTTKEKKRYLNKCDRFNFKIDFEESDTAKAKEIIHWFLEQSPNNDYMQTCYNLTKANAARYRDFGYVVSMVNTFNKAMIRQAKEEARKKALQKDIETSQYLGDAGETLNIENIASCKVLTSWANGFGDYTILYQFKDIDGNVIIWKTTKGIDTEKEIAILKGKIKELKEFRGIKQTVLTRCKVTYK